MADRSVQIKRYNQSSDAWENINPKTLASLVTYGNSTVSASLDAHAGGTAVTLNGTSKAGSSASFYAPTGAGTSGQYLASAGSGAPSWTSKGSVASGNSALVDGGTVYTAIQNAIASTYKACGSVDNDDLADINLANEAVGNVYNITTQLTTTANFVEGAGKTYPAGTNVVCVDSAGGHKWDVLSGLVDLSGYYTSAQVDNALAGKVNTATIASYGTFGDSSAQTPGYGGTFKVPYITVNASGLVTAISEHTVTIPASDNTNTWRSVKLDGTEKLGTGTGTNALNIKAGSNMTITESNGTFTFASSYTNTTYSAGAGLALDGTTFKLATVLGSSAPSNPADGCIYFATS